MATRKTSLSKILAIHVLLRIRRQSQPSLEGLWQGFRLSAENRAYLFCTRTGALNSLNPVYCHEYPTENARRLQAAACSGMDHFAVLDCHWPLRTCCTCVCSHDRRRQPTHANSRNCRESIWIACNASFVARLEPDLFIADAGYQLLWLGRWQALQPNVGV